MVEWYEAANWQDYLDGVQLFQRVPATGEMLKITIHVARNCPSNMAGESYHVGWSWNGYDVGEAKATYPSSGTATWRTSAPSGNQNPESSSW